MQQTWYNMSDNVQLSNKKSWSFLSINFLIYSTFYRCPPFIKTASWLGKTSHGAVEPPKNKREGSINQNSEKNEQEKLPGENDIMGEGQEAESTIAFGKRQKGKPASRGHGYRVQGSSARVPVKIALVLLESKFTVYLCCPFIAMLMRPFKHPLYVPVLSSGK